MHVTYRDQADLVNAPLVSGYGGQQERDWDAASVKADIPCNVQPDDGSEELERRETTVTRWRLFCGPSEPLTAYSRVRWAGALDPDGVTVSDLEVEGDVEVHSLRGRRHHLEVRLKRVRDV